MCVNGEALISVGSAYGGPRGKIGHYVSLCSEDSGSMSPTEVGAINTPTVTRDPISTRHCAVIAAADRRTSS